MSLKQRLGLFRTVCDAVQYAHQQSVIHRDLKPSNILVTQDGQVKLVDFGISESVYEAQAPEKEWRSGYMTLAYAAPEQVERAPSAVQADVYALGVILQQLLTGQLPFDPEGKDTEQIRQMILHSEPRTPSSLGKREFATRSQWSELDAICSKALQKDPGAGYGSVEALAADLKRFENIEPLACRRPHGWTYLSRKFFRRNRVYILSGSAIAAVLIAVIAFYTYNLRIARNEALDKAKRAADVQAFVVELFEQFDPEQSKVSRESAEAILSRGEKVARSLRGQPLVQAEVFNTLGTGLKIWDRTNGRKLCIRQRWRSTSKCPAKTHRKR